ncbi:MAG: hypothetical protein ACK502_02220 [Alphaproteobacteria bacterium]
MKKYTIAVLSGILALASAMPMNVAAQVTSTTVPSVILPAPIFSSLPVGHLVTEEVSIYPPGVTAQQIANDMGGTPASRSRLGYINERLVNKCIGTFAQCHAGAVYLSGMVAQVCAKKMIGTQTVSTYIRRLILTLKTHTGAVAFHMDYTQTIPCP